MTQQSVSTETMALGGGEVDKRTPPPHLLDIHSSKALDSNGL